MLKTILGALVPTAFTMLVGYLSARHHRFGSKDATVLNRMVMTYALPLSIFVGMVSNSRTALLQDLVVLIALVAAILGVYAVVYVLCRRFFRLSVGASALGALAASMPNALFMGLPVLSFLYQAAGVVPATLGSIVPQTTVVPLTVFLLSMEASQRARQPNKGPAPSARKEMAANLLHTFAQPLVWSAFLGLVLVLGGFHVPVLITDSLALLGHATTGVALFASGVILAGYAVSMSGPVLFQVFIKNIAQPALVLGCLLLLGYSKQLLGEAVVTTAMPTAAILPMFAVQYQVGERDSSSALLLSTVGSILTLSGFIALTSG